MIRFNQNEADYQQIGKSTRENSAYEDHREEKLRDQKYLESATLTSSGEAVSSVCLYNE
jgi:hypothetical protein